MKPTTEKDFSLKMFAKCGFLIFSRAIGFGLLGLVLNLFLLILAWPEIRSAFDIGHAAHTSLAWVVLIFSVPFLLSLILFVAPILYFIFGQKHGVNHAIHYVFSQNHDYLMQLVMDKFRDFVEKRQLLTTGRASEKIPALLGNYLNKIDNLPKPIAWLTKRFILKANIVTAAKSVSQQPEADKLNLAQFLSTTAQEVGKSINAQTFQPSITWLWILLTINLSVFTLLKLNY
jgi:hypothetical protein